MAKYFAFAYIKHEPLISATEIIKKFVLFDFNGYMWFFVPLLLIYVALPFFAVFVINSSRELLRTFLVIGLVMGCIPPLESSFSTREGIENIYLMGSRFLLYIVAGYYIGNYEISRLTRRRLYALTILSIATIFIGTSLLSIFAPEHYKYFISYTNIPCTISAFGVFTFFRYQDWDTLLGRIHVKASTLATLSGLSLGIYLVQELWFNVVNRIHLLQGKPLLRFLLMYIACASFVWLVKRIPVVKRIMG